jgi:hypothetical protein
MLPPARTVRHDVACNHPILFFSANPGSACGAGAGRPVGELANAVTNRRKAGSGLSLELHARTIFDEEGLRYSHVEVSEGKKRPDFLFP